MNEEKGGVTFTISPSWITRWKKRWNLSTRVATTKMRELPQEFEQLLAVYLKIASYAVNQHTVPLELVYGLDETNVQFVNNSKKTIDVKGGKRIRVIGVGKEKPQITVTYVVKEDGTVLDLHQLIFGGKTAEVHPSIAQINSLFAHSESHWQDEDTYMELIERTVICDMKETIKRLGLSKDQKVVRKHAKYLIIMSISSKLLIEIYS